MPYTTFVYMARHQFPSSANFEGRLARRAQLSGREGVFLAISPLSIPLSGSLRNQVTRDPTPTGSASIYGSLSTTARG